MLKVLLCALLMFSVAPLTGCASRQQAPEDQSVSGVKPLRVVLVNHTDAPLQYRYLTLSDSKNESGSGPSSYQTNVTINLDWKELSPEAKAHLDVMPGSILTLKYLALGVEHEQSVQIQKAQQLSIDVDGPQSGVIAPEDNQPVIRFGS